MTGKTAEGTAALNGEDDVIQQRIFDFNVAASVGLPDDRFPITTEEAEKVEAELARRLGMLSVDEHERALFDIHGLDTFADDGTEERSFIDAKLKELQQELDRIPIQRKAAYERAKRLNRSYVENEQFQLMFLRNDKFNAKDAAAILCHHFEVKQQIFVYQASAVDGIDKKPDEDCDESILVRDILWSDLDTDDRLCAMTGWLQVCPNRDTAGRTILFASPGYLKAKTLLNCARAYFYLTMSMLRDADTRKNGIVKVMYNFREHTRDLAFIKKVRRLQVAVPLPIVCGHYCSNKMAFKPVISAVRLLLLDDYKRWRITTHFGDLKRVQFELQTFGIPVEDSPMDERGVLSVAGHLKWLETQAALEKKLVEIVPPPPPSDDSPASTSPTLVSVDEEHEPSHDLTGTVPDFGLDETSNKAESSTAILVPRRYDVLFGKTKQCRQHTGNLKCQHLVDTHWDQYEAASRRDKTKVADLVINLIRESEGRFLKWEDGLWIEVDQKVARDKVSHFFRLRRSHMAAMASSSSSSASTSSARSVATKRVFTAEIPFEGGNTMEKDFDLVSVDDGDDRGGPRVRVEV